MKKIILLILVVLIMAIPTSGMVIKEHDRICKKFGDAVDDKQWDVELESYSGTYCTMESEELKCRSSSEETDMNKNNYICIDTVDLRVYEILPGAIQLI